MISVLLAINLLLPSYNLADASRDLQAGNFDTAIPRLEGMRISESEQFEATKLLVAGLRSRAYKRYHAGQYSEALVDLVRVSQLSPGDTLARRDISTVYAAMGDRALAVSDTDLAENSFRKALQFDAAQPAARRALCWIACARGRTFQVEGRSLEAISQYRRALDWDSTDVGAHLMLGQLYYEREDFALAQHHLRQARELTTVRIQGLDDLLARVNREFEVTKSYRTVEVGGFLVRFEGTERFDLFYLIQPILQDAQNRAAMLLEYRPQKPLTVIIYADTSMARAVDQPGWATGLFDGKIRLRAAEIVGSTARSTPLIRHEVAHAVIEEMAPRRVPCWLHEGIAQYLERDRWDPFADAPYLVASLKNRHAYTLAALAPGFAQLPPGSDIRLAYAQSLAVVRYLVTVHGEPCLARILKLIAEGRTPEQAVDSVTFYDLDTLQSRVNDWVLWEFNRP